MSYPFVPGHFVTELGRDFGSGGVVGQQFVGNIDIAIKVGNVMLIISHFLFIIKKSRKWEIESNVRI